MTGFNYTHKLILFYKLRPTGITVRSLANHTTADKSGKERSYSHGNGNAKFLSSEHGKILVTV